MKSLIYVWSLFLALIAPNIAFQVINLRHGSRLNKNLIRVENKNAPLYRETTVKASFGSDPIEKNDIYNDNYQSKSSQSIKMSSKGSFKKALIATSIISYLAFGFSHSANAGVIDILQEKASSSGFLEAFLLIFVSEIGDKTFFIAGLLAAKYSRLISFTGSIGALIVMTFISTVLGQLFNAVPPSFTKGVPFSEYIAITAFLYFGLKTLYDSSQLADDDNSGIAEEKEDAEKTIEELQTNDQIRKSIISKIFQTFTVVFAAEIGDRSFLSTIALSAANNPFAVAIGAIAAHASATGIAVLGGSLMSKYLSEKVIGYIGGSLFVIFAITTALGVF